MTIIKRFEDLDVWRKARILSKELYDKTRTGNLSRDYSLKDQIKRSSGSIMDNIAEGFERNGIKEFRQFLSIAKGSTGELKSQLYRSLDQDYIKHPEFTHLYNRTDEISKMISGLMKYLNVSTKKGIKFYK